MLDRLSLEVADADAETAIRLSANGSEVLVTVSAKRRSFPQTQFFLSQKGARDLAFALRTLAPEAARDEPAEAF